MQLFDITHSIRSAAPVGGIGDIWLARPTRSFGFRPTDRLPCVFLSLDRAARPNGTERSVYYMLALPRDSHSHTHVAQLYSTIVHGVDRNTIPVYILPWFLIRVHREYAKIVKSACRFIPLRIETCLAFATK